MKGQIFRHRYRSSKEALNDVNFQIRHGGNGRRGGEDVSRDRFDSIDPFNLSGYRRLLYSTSRRRTKNVHSRKILGSRVYVSMFIQKKIYDKKKKILILHFQMRNNSDRSSYRTIRSISCRATCSRP